MPPRHFPTSRSPALPLGALFAALLSGSALASTSPMLQGSAKALEPGPVQTFRSPLKEIHVAEAAGDSSAWIRGTDYKAKVSPAGMTFIPFLGSRAPRNYPATFTVASISVGGRPMALPAATRVIRDGDRFSLRRGPLTVHYDADLQSIEQSFCIDVGSARGEVEVTVHVDSELVGENTPAGLRWSGPMGGLRYGAATAFTPLGETISAPSHLEPARNPGSAGPAGSAPGGSTPPAAIHMRVPADFVARCAGEVLIDPVISSYGFTVDPGNGGSLGRPDVAYDVSTDSFLYAYEERFSGADSDIWWTQRSSKGDLMAAGSFDVSDTSYEEPTVAGSNYRNRGLIAALEITEPALRGGHLVGRVFSFSNGALNGAQNGPIVIQSAGIKDVVKSPDAGGDQRSWAGARFAVAYTRRFEGEEDVFVATVDLNGQLDVVYPLGSSPSTDATAPAISKSGGRGTGAARWTIAWAERGLHSGRSSVQVAQLGTSGSLLVAPTTYHEAPVGQSIRGVDVSDVLLFPGEDPTYMTSWFQTSPGSSPAGEHLIGLGEGGLRTWHEEAWLKEHSDSGRSRTFAKLGTVDGRFALAFSEAPTAPGEAAKGYVSTFAPVLDAGLGLAERRLETHWRSSGTQLPWARGCGVALVRG